MTGTDAVDAVQRPHQDGGGRVFVSHVEEDAQVALSIADGLEAAGYPTWCYERDALPGPSYLLQTGREIERSSAVVLVISPSSLSSNQVTSEVVRAHESGRPFVPVLVGISHVEFAARQPEWREALGSATSIAVPASGPQAIIPRIVQGLVGLGIQAVPGYEPRSGAASILLRTPPRARTRHTLAYVAAAVVFVAALVGVGLSVSGGGGKEAIDTSSNTQEAPGEETSTTDTPSGDTTVVPPPSSSVPAGGGETPMPTTPAPTTSPAVTSRPPATTSPPPPQTTEPPSPPEEEESTLSTAAGPFYVFPPSVDEEWCHPDRIDCETDGPFLVVDLSYEGSGGMNVNDAFLAEARQSTISWAGGSAGYRDSYVETFTDFVQVVYSPVPSSPPDGDFFLHWPNNSQVRLEVY